MSSRFFILFVLIILLTGLCYYGGTHTPWLKLSTCLEHPEKYDGQRVTYIREPKIEKVTPEGFILNHGGDTLPVIADTTGLKANEYIGLVAIFHKEGYLEAVDMVISKNRRYKILLSVIPVLLTAFLFFRSFKINWKTMQFEMKHA
ncbi:hypothetical protein JW835_06830 [bacterium]|nr:hypothetical protein [bacterium]